MTETWFITVKVTADPATFRDGEEPDNLLSVIRDEIIANLEECGAQAEIEPAVREARLSAAAPALLAALYSAFDALRQLSDEAGDVAFFNEGGDGYAACQAARAALDRAEPAVQS